MCRVVRAVAVASLSPTVGIFDSLLSSAVEFRIIMSQSSPLRIVLASRNKKKTREVSEILLPY
jgi:hypothetical protein